MLARLLDAALVRVLISAAVAMCLECADAKGMTKKLAEGSGVCWVSAGNPNPENETWQDVRMLAHSYRKTAKQKCERPRNSAF